MSIALKQVFNKDKTFRPKRKFEPGTQRFELHKRAQASLNSGVDLKAAVQLPSGEDQNDWVAVHVVDFFNRINLIYGTICEFCTEQTCPVMSGGPKYEYRWQDDLKYKKPTALPAPQYMNLLMDWIEVQINNEDIFPTCVERDDEQDVSLMPHLTLWKEEENCFLLESPVGRQDTSLAETAHLLLGAGKVETSLNSQETFPPHSVCS
ncbi:MOB kinase activator 3B isoform X4 [Manis pentadactyla]|uniref:MOB kinase activator 3B isoform X4 n=1 Tax=Manis pentadactyla TaxID=143292 RepID=UPI00255C6E63|nr:MOB kinase activator 3B isoform X4 [Manis pentadactyla]